MTTTVKIKTGSHEIELTIDEARQAYQELGKLFGAAKEIVPLPCPYPVPYTVPYSPTVAPLTYPLEVICNSPTVAPLTYPWEITCNSGTVTKS